MKVFEKRIKEVDQYQNQNLILVVGSKGVESVDRRDQPECMIGVSAVSRMWAFSEMITNLLQ